MKLLPEWKFVLRRAWSIRLGVLAAALSAAEVVLPMFSDAFARGTFAALSAVTTAAALVARLLAQQE